MVSDFVIPSFLHSSTVLSGHPFGLAPAEGFYSIVPHLKASVVTTNCCRTPHLHLLTGSL